LGFIANTLGLLRARDSAFEVEALSRFFGLEEIARRAEAHLMTFLLRAATGG
jgi:hypothetical protein